MIESSIAYLLLLATLVSEQAHGGPMCRALAWRARRGAVFGRLGGRLCLIRPTLAV